jgi:hypothetical protein
MWIWTSFIISSDFAQYLNILYQMWNLWGLIFISRSYTTYCTCKSRSITIVHPRGHFLKLSGNVLRTLRRQHIGFTRSFGKYLEFVSVFLSLPFPRGVQLRFHFATRTSKIALTRSVVHKQSTSIHTRNKNTFESFIFILSLSHTRLCGIMEMYAWVFPLVPKRFSERIRTQYLTNREGSIRSNV